MSRHTISAITVNKALHSPGGSVQQFATKVGRSATARARRDAPVNDPLNALHRGGKVGTYKASFYSKRVQGNQHQSIVEVGNRADHAVFVEFGRSSSAKYQAFTWRHGWRFGSRRKRQGMWANYIFIGRRGFPKRTAARPGKLVLTGALQEALAKYGIALTHVSGPDRP